MSCWYETKKIDLLRSINPENIVVFDTETTGLNPKKNDEILQLSIVDGNGTSLFDEYIKPSKRVRWPDAEKINGITPAMVADKHTMTQVGNIVQDIFNKAKLIIGYNVGFDISFLEASGISIPKNVFVFDVMMEIAPVLGSFNIYHGDFKWVNLEKCAKHYNYKFLAHNSLEDTKATLFCYNKMMVDNDNNGYLDLVANYRNNASWYTKRDGVETSAIKRNETQSQTNVMQNTKPVNKKKNDVWWAMLGVFLIILGIGSGSLWSALLLIIIGIMLFPGVFNKVVSFVKTFINGNKKQ